MVELGAFPGIVLSSSKGDVLVRPSKIIALGLNYHDHIREGEKMGIAGFDDNLPAEPVFFTKTTNALLAHEENIVLPALVDDYGFDAPRTDYEGELAIVIGRECFEVDQGKALDYVAGYSCFNDVSQRNIQNLDKSGWFRGKSFNTFAPCGQRLALPDEVGNPDRLKIQTRLNGKVVQDANTADMIFSVPQIIHHVSRNFRLFPGDIITTGTPSGVGALVPGDIVEVEIEHVGILRNSVVKAPNKK